MPNADIPKHMQIPVPEANRYKFILLKKDSEEFAALPESERAELIVTGEPKAILLEFFRTAGANLEFAEGRYQFLFRGMMADTTPGHPFWSVISMLATQPVTIHREAWLAKKSAVYYRDANGGFYMKGFTKDGKTFDLNPGDFAADDWSIVNDPNVVATETDITDENAIPDDPAEYGTEPTIE